MDIGTNLWKRRVDNIAREMGENLDLERTVVTQRASELQADAHKVCRGKAGYRDVKNVFIPVLRKKRFCSFTGYRGSLTVCTLWRGLPERCWDHESAPFAFGFSFNRA